jgi:hypothetical protein
MVISYKSDHPCKLICKNNSVPDPGSLSRILSFSVPDLGSRVNNKTKEEEKKLPHPFDSYKFNKIVNIEFFIGSEKDLS